MHILDKCTCPIQQFATDCRFNRRTLRHRFTSSVATPIATYLYIYIHTYVHIIHLYLEALLYNWREASYHSLHCVRTKEVIHNVFQLVSKSLRFVPKSSFCSVCSKLAKTMHAWQTVRLQASKRELFSPILVSVVRHHNPAIMHK